MKTALAFDGQEPIPGLENVRPALAAVGQRFGDLVSSAMEMLVDMERVVYDALQEAEKQAKDLVDDCRD